MTELKFPVIEMACRLKGGDLWDKDLMDLIREVVDKLKQQSGFDWEQIDALYLANCFAQATHQIGMLDTLIAEMFGLDIPLMWWTGSDLAGTKALERACIDVARGTHGRILLLGVEQMSVLPDDEQQDLFKVWLSADEQRAGLGLPGTYALLAQAYLDNFKIDPDQLAEVSVLNHRHGVTNPLAQFKREITRENVGQSALVSSPLRQLHLAPVGDGVSAVVVCKSSDTDLVRVQSCGFGYEPMAVAERSLTELGAVRSACRKALGAGNILLSDFNAVVVADKFSIDAVLSLEALGLSKAGKALDDIAAGKFSLAGDCPLNPRGGLKTGGFAPGASSLSQIVEGVEFLHSAKSGQVLVSSVGGSGYESSAFVLGRGGLD